MPKAEVKIENRRRVSNIQGVFMIAVAGVVDGIQFLLNFIPIMGWIFSALVSVFAFLLFYLWFKLNGVTFMESILKFIIRFVVMVLEIIPVLNFLPLWFLSTIIMIFIIKAEDTLYNKTGKDVKIAKVLKKYKKRIA